MFTLIHSWPLALLFAFGITSVAAAQIDQGKQGSKSSAVQSPEDDFGEGDELLMYEDLDVVVTATRTPTPLNLAPVPVTVISAEDISKSGQTNLPEILQFATGVDVLQIDRMRYAVGIRGQHEFFSDRTITMINGRNASSPLFGGTEFLRLPLFMADIDRIEVVRGPGGAAWGANAFNGVINIITKKPEDVSGTYVEAGATHFGDHYGHLRWAGSSEDLGWRVSLGHQGVVSSDAALDDHTFDSKDRWDASRIDTEFDWQTEDGARVSAGGSYSYLEEGAFDSGFFMPGGTGRLWNGRAFVKVEQDLSADTSGYLQFFSNGEKMNVPSLGVFTAHEHDLEGQLDSTVSEGHQVTVGGNLRYVRVGESSDGPQQITLPSEPFDEFWAGLFVIDRQAMSDSTTFEVQLRGDYYSETDFDWSGRLSGIFTPDDERRHSFRVGVAKAYRAPLTGLRTFSTSRVPVGPTFALQTVPSAGIENEKIFSLELGHTFQASKAWRLRTDTYYQHFDDLIGFRTLSGPIPTIITFDNIDSAKGYGAEIELEWRGECASVSSWYAYQELEPSQGSQSIRAFHPARHKVGMTARAKLPAGITCNINYKYSGDTPSESSGETVVDEFHRLDLSLSKSINNGQGEFLIGVADILNDTEFTVPGTQLAGQSTSIGTHDTPGITVFASMRFRF